MSDKYTNEYRWNMKLESLRIKFQVSVMEVEAVILIVPHHKDLSFMNELHQIRKHKKGERGVNII